MSYLLPISMTSPYKSRGKQPLKEEAVPAMVIIVHVVILRFSYTGTYKGKEHLTRNQSAPPEPTLQ